MNICHNGISSRQQIFTEQEEIDEVNRKWDELEKKIGLDYDVYGTIESSKVVEFWCFYDQVKEKSINFFPLRKAKVLSTCFYME
jgi:hypothetical protein